ncbi:PilW family protein [Teredinibacter turnerae]|uniref:PilW family protein n=1 Tax=Teredinibacter turnerae TaxID=2426 RepID=UPI0030CBB91C
MKMSIFNSRGLTLIEMLVAMAVGGIILAGGVVVYSDQVQSSKRLSAYSTLQESGRVALDIIERDIRMAGFKGCFSTAEEIENNIAGGGPATFQPQFGVQGWEAPNTANGETIANVGTNTAVVATNSGGWLTTAGNVIDTLNAIPTSDILRVWSAGDQEMVVENIAYGAAPIADVSDSYQVDAGDFYILSDCQQAIILQACAVGTSGANSRLTFSDSCSPGNDTPIPELGDNPSLTRLVGATYIVGKLSNNSRNPPSLFRAEMASNGVIGNPQELVQGVESMQLLYGENRDDDNFRSADVYVTANNVQDWNNVISVRVSLLLQSIDNNLSEGPVPYTFNGVTYDGAGNNPAVADNRLRRVFTRTITLRNRTLGS